MIAACISMPFVGPWLPVPFHLVWLSLALIYGFVVWSNTTTAVVLALVTVATGGMLAWAVVDQAKDVPELTEIPMMTMIFGMMFWHVRRRQRSMEAVRRAQERERDFVRDLSHQLRTPITIARGHAELLRDAVAESDVDRDLDVVVGELKRLSKLADRLLLLAAAEHEDFLHRQTVSFEGLLVETGRRWVGAADRRWATYVRAEGTVDVDVDRITDALDAVLENAVKFTRHDDLITIVGDAAGSTAIVEITDTGTGIPADQVWRVFDRFARATNGEAARGSTGLGLPIVKAIVEAHGGTVALESEATAGTMVRIELPSFRPVAQVAVAPALGVP